MILKKISLFFLVIIITSAFGGLPGYGAEEIDTGVPGEAYHNQKGLSHFKKGFYSSMTWIHMTSIPTC